MKTHEGDTVEQVSALNDTVASLERLHILIADSNTAQIYALNNVDPALDRLDKALAVDRAARITGLNTFKADNALERLKQLTAEQHIGFDALDFIGRSLLGSGRGLWGSEEFHSNVLAWLLNPKESHGLGDRFLKDFLVSSGVKLSGHPLDRSATKVIREWENLVDEQQGYLDILIVNEAQQVVCAIENKVFSTEHSAQLTRYRLALGAAYSNFTRFHVFLTRRGELAFREEERRHWTPLTYLTVYEIIRQIIQNDDDSPNQGVHAFLRQYATTLRRNIMPDTSIPQLARRIYLEHWEAMDQIIANKPNWAAEAKQWLKEAVAQHQQWKLDVEDTNYVRFRSTDWDRYQATQTGTGWAPRSNALLLFQFRFYNGLFWLDLGLSTGVAANNRLRQKLFEAVRQQPKLFKPTATILTDNWIILHQEDDHILDETDYGIGWDDGTTRAKVERWVARFAESDFPAMNEIIVGCLREYEEEQREGDP